MSGEEIICGCGDHLTGCDYPVVGARCPTCAMLDRDEIEWLQKQCEMLTKERDEARGWSGRWKFAARSRFPWREMEDIRRIDIEDTNRAVRERDEARVEVERLTVVCEEAGMQVGLLEREVERLRRGIEAYRRLVSVHRVESHGVNTHQTITNNNHASAVWQWEAEQ